MVLSLIGKTPFFTTYFIQGVEETRLSPAKTSASIQRTIGLTSRYHDRENTQAKRGASLGKPPARVSNQIGSISTATESRSHCVAGTMLYCRHLYAGYGGYRKAPTSNMRVEQIEFTTPASWFPIVRVFQCLIC